LPDSGRSREGRRGVKREIAGKHDGRNGENGTGSSFKHRRGIYSPPPKKKVHAYSLNNYGVENERKEGKVSEKEDN